MHIVVVYDSIHGNTARIAKAIAEALENGNSVKLLAVQDVTAQEVSEADLLVVGSPTRGFRPTPRVSEFLEGLGTVSKGKIAAVFDTRIDLETVNPPPLRWVVDAGGYAAARMDEMLRRHGLERRGELAGFLVTGTEGPLKDGEIDRAIAWANELRSNAAAD